MFGSILRFSIFSHIFIFLSTPAFLQPYRKRFGEILPGRSDRGV
jgi:hypothetical protein